MSQDKQDPELKETLQGKTELSQRYRRSSREQPPAHLDEAILAASRRAVKSRPHLASSPFSSDWHVPVSLAAVLALCITLVVTMQERPVDNALQPPAQVQPAAAGGEEQKYDARTNVPVKLEGKVMREQDAMAPAAGLAGRREDSGAYGPTASDIATVREQPLSPEALQKKKRAESALRPLRQKKNALRREMGANEKIIAPTVMAKPETALPERRVSREYAERMALGISSKEPLAKPEEWLKSIDQLWKQGNKQEAAGELKAFMRSYPGYPVEKLKIVLAESLLKSVVNDFTDRPE
ncbi:MAG: hypothetical protein ACE5GZ_00775 [Gammaproteobacteria bacterium]